MHYFYRNVIKKTMASPHPLYILIKNYHKLSEAKRNELKSSISYDDIKKAFIKEQEKLKKYGTISHITKLLSIEPQLNNVANFFNMVLDSSSFSLKLAKLLYKHNNAVVLNPMIFTKACQYGLFDLIAWLYEVMPIKNFAQAFIQVCVGGNVHNIAEWLISKQPMLIKDIDRISRIKLLHEDLQTEIAEYIVNSFGHIMNNEIVEFCGCKIKIMNMINSKYEINYSLLFVHACSKNFLETAKWVFGKYSSVTQIKFINNVFYLSYEHVAVLEWLLRMCPKINVFANNHELFNLVCLCGIVETMDWMVKKYPLVYDYITVTPTVGFTVYHPIIYPKRLNTVGIVVRVRQNCIICGNISDGMVEIPCGHHYCNDCLSVYIDLSNNPSCAKCQCVIKKIYEIA